jgi:hypothetical protein
MKLRRRLRNGAAIPSRPAHVQVVVLREAAIFVREDQNIIFENNQQIADFLADWLIAAALSPENIGIAPRRQKRVAA